MKTSIKTIVVTISILINTFSYAQQIVPTDAEQLKSEQETLRNTPYIFEGTVVSQEQIRNLARCSIVRITKIFKGSPQIILGSVKIMTYQNSDNTWDGLVGIYNDIKYLFFCDTIKDSKLFLDRIIATDNSQLFQGGQFIRFEEEEHNKYSSFSPAALWKNGAGNHKFNTLEDLYTYLSNNGLTVQAEEQKK